MKAQELRIRNYARRKQDGIVFQLNSDEIRWIDYGLNLDSFGKEIFEAIELTEEWLLKFGFVKRGIYYHFPKNDIFKLEQYKNKNAFWLRHGTESIDCTRINYVHSLQNLYFALTGEELKIDQQ
jgi:hypothetical protein